MMIQVEMRKMIGNGYLKSDMRAFHTKWRRARAPWLLVKFIPLGGKQVPWRLWMFFPEIILSWVAGERWIWEIFPQRKLMTWTWKKTWGSEALQFVSAPSQVPDWVIEFQGRLVSVGRRRAQPSSRAVKVEGKHKERVVGFPKLSS